MLKLSIVIPTYNRNQTLLATLERVLLQLRPGVELRILDNASSVPVADTLAPLLARHADKDVQVVRHRVNVGAHANILRAYEVAGAPWVWILGDDDVVHEQAVDTILDTLAQQPHAVFLNFSTESMQLEGLRPQPFDTRGQAGFIDGLDAAGNINFMSVGVWHAPTFVPWLARAYHFAYSMSHCFVLLLSALGEAGVCHFSRRVLINQVTTAQAGAKWQVRDFVLGWNTILELPMSAASRRVLASKMLSWHLPENVCVYLLADAAIRGTDGRLYDLAARRLGPYVSGSARLRYQLYRPLFWAPQRTWPWVAAAVKFAVARRLTGFDLTDLVDRVSHEVAARA